MLVSGRDRPEQRPGCLDPLGRRSADVFVSMGVTIGQGAVVGARSTVTRDIPPWTVAVGSPARVVKPREMVAQRP
jgi:serine acetyltransferase